MTGESQVMLEIHHLHAEVDGKAVLNGLNLKVQAGEVHAIMGPNGSGKSTLAHVLAGRPKFKITDGSVFYQGQDLTQMEAHERSLAGLFLAMQYPTSIPGVTNVNFLKSIVNAHRKHQGKDELDPMDFLALVKHKAASVGLDPDLLYRAVNDGFSGGEKKRNDILQMLLLEPTLCVLDETDSGLDIDALKTVAHSVNSQRGDDKAFVIITHYKRLLSHIVPDVVHVLAQGRIVKSGDRSLVDTLEQEGYGWIDSP